MEEEKRIYGYLAVDGDGTEWMFVYPPKKIEEENKWKSEIYRVFPTHMAAEMHHLELPKGTIKRITGKDLKFEDGTLALTDYE